MNALTDMSGRLDSLAKARKFILAGNATVTLVSKSTGTRFTYRIRQASNDDGTKKLFWFVSLLTGSDNETDYKYFAHIYQNGGIAFGRKSQLKEGNASVRAWFWFWENLDKGLWPSIDNGVEVWHEGKCGRCNRKLTVPQSVSSGFGPECSRYM